MDKPIQPGSELNPNRAGWAMLQYSQGQYQSQFGPRNQAGIAVNRAKNNTPVVKGKVAQIRLRKE